MTEKEPKFTKKIIEIADYFYANPEKKTKEVISLFCGKFRKTERTIENYIKKAKEYNFYRINEQEKVRNEVLVEETKNSLKSSILSRNDKLEVLSNIAQGKGRKVGEELLIPSDGDRIRAIGELNKMQGDYAPEKRDLRVESKPQPTPEEIGRVFKAMENS